MITSENNECGAKVTMGYVYTHLMKVHGVTRPSNKHHIRGFNMISRQPVFLFKPENDPVSNIHIEDNLVKENIIPINSIDNIKTECGTSTIKKTNIASTTVKYKMNENFNTQSTDDSLNNSFKCSDVYSCSQPSTSKCLINQDNDENENILENINESLNHILSQPTQEMKLTQDSNYKQKELDQSQSTEQQFLNSSAENILSQCNQDVSYISSTFEGILPIQFENESDNIFDLQNGIIKSLQNNDDLHNYFLENESHLFNDSFSDCFLQESSSQKQSNSGTKNPKYKLKRSKSFSMFDNKKTNSSLKRSKSHNLIVNVFEDFDISLIKDTFDSKLDDSDYVEGNKGKGKGKGKNRSKKGSKLAKKNFVKKRLSLTSTLDHTSDIESREDNICQKSILSEIVFEELQLGKEDNHKKISSINKVDNETSVKRKLDLTSNIKNKTDSTSNENKPYLKRSKVEGNVKHVEVIPVKKNKRKRKGVGKKANDQINIFMVDNYFTNCYVKINKLKLGSNTEEEKEDGSCKIKEFKRKKQYSISKTENTVENTSDEEKESHESEENIFDMYDSDYDDDDTDSYSNQRIENKSIRHEKRNNYVDDVYKNENNSQFIEKMKVFMRRKLIDTQNKWPSTITKAFSHLFYSNDSFLVYNVKKDKSFNLNQLIDFETNNYRSLKYPGNWLGK